MNEELALPALGNLSLKQIRDITPEDLFKLVQTDNLGRRKIITLDLSTAGSTRWTYAGNYLKMIDATDSTVRVSIQYNRPDDDTASFRLNTREKRYFRDIFVSWSAQAGKTATFVLAFDGTNTLYDHDSFDPVSNITSLATITGDIAGLTALPTGATEVYAKGSVNGATTATIYTNGTGKTVKIIQSSLFCFNNTAALQAILMQVHDGSSFTKQINSVGCITSYFNGLSLVHLPPIEVPNGHTVRIGGYDANLAASATLCYAAGLFRGFYV